MDYFWAVVMIRRPCGLARTVVSHLSLIDALECYNPSPVSQHQHCFQFTVGAPVRKYAAAVLASQIKQWNISQWNWKFPRLRIIKLRRHSGSGIHNYALPTHHHSDPSEQCYHVFKRHRKDPGIIIQYLQCPFPGYYLQRSSVSLELCWGTFPMIPSPYIWLNHHRQLNKTRTSVSYWWNRPTNCSMRLFLLTQSWIPGPICPQAC